MSNDLALLKLCSAVRELWGSSPLVDPNSFTENKFDTKHNYVYKYSPWNCWCKLREERYWDLKVAVQIPF